MGRRPSRPAGTARSPLGLGLTCWPGNSWAKVHLCTPSRVLHIPGPPRQWLRDPHRAAHGSPEAHHPCCKRMQTVPQPRGWVERGASPTTFPSSWAPHPPLHQREQEAQRQGHGVNGFEEEKFGPEIRARWLGSPWRVPFASQP